MENIAIISIILIMLKLLNIKNTINITIDNIKKPLEFPINLE